VLFLSLGEGLRQVFTQQLGSAGPDLQVSYGPLDANLLNSVPNLPLERRDALLAVADRYGILDVIPVLLYVRGGLSLTQSFVFEGVPPREDLANIFYDIEVVQGRALAPTDADAPVAVVGEVAAERNHLAIGDELRLTPDARFTIVGLMRTGGGLLDNSIAVPLAPLQRALGISDRVSFFAVNLAEPGLADRTAAALHEAFPDLGFQTRADLLSVLKKGIEVSDVVRLGISAIALIVGAIAVANTMLMSVFERTREFGVVRAVGGRPRFLFALVLAESLLLSLIGGAGGVLLGRLGAIVVNEVARGLIGLEVAAVTGRLVLFAVAVASAMGLLSGLVPAARAARIPIAVALARE
jgi:putative ABC transport system permease protein